MSDLELFLVGLILSATAEISFDDYLRLWDHQLDRTWREIVTRKGWQSQAFHWGNPN